MRTKRSVLWRTTVCFVAMGLLASGAELGDQLAVAEAHYELRRLEMEWEKLKTQEYFSVERHPYASPSLDGTETQVVGVP